MFYKQKHIQQSHWEITWKNGAKFSADVFDSLKDFCIKNPSYNGDDLLNSMKARRRYQYEDEQLIIRRIPFQYKGIAGDRPQLRDNFFWDVSIPDMEWNRDYTFVIERVLARGRNTEYEEIIRFYGLETVINTFRNQARFWPEHIEENARIYFKLQPEDLLVHHQRLLNDDWNVWKKNYLGQDDIKEA
jgi:hypothetical protein